MEISDFNFNFIEFIGFREKPFRIVFNPSKFYDKIDKYKDNLEGLIKYLRLFKVVVTQEPSDVGYWYVEGSYSDNQCYIHIHGDPVHGYDASWHSFKLQLIMVLMHELIHYYQELNNDEFILPRTDDYVSYYMAKHESLPLAHDIAIETILFGSSQTLESVKSYIGGTKTYNEILKRVYKFMQKYNEIL